MGAFDSLQKHFEREDARRKADVKRWEELDEDLCQMCHAYGADKRSLMLRCGYAVHEVVPEVIDLSEVKGKGDPLAQFYYLRICKSCRARLLGMLGHWREECAALRGTPKDHDGYIEVFDQERNIPVRVNGAIVYMDEYEYEQYRNRQADKKESA